MGSMSASDAAPLPRLGEVYFDVRGESRSMRLSWYADTGVAVFSIWQGGTCTGTFRLPIADLPRMIEALQRGPDGDSGIVAEQPAAGQAPRSGPARAPQPGMRPADDYGAEPATGYPASGRGDGYRDELDPGHPAGGEYRDEAGAGYSGSRSSGRYRDELTGEYGEKPGTGYSGSRRASGHPGEPAGTGRPDGRRASTHRAAAYEDEPTGVYREGDPMYSGGGQGGGYDQEPTGPYPHDSRSGGYPDDSLPGSGYHDDGPPGRYEPEPADSYPGDRPGRREPEHTAAYPAGRYEDEPTGVYRGDLLQDEGYADEPGGRYAAGEYPGDPLSSDYPTGPSVSDYPGAGDHGDYPEPSRDPGSPSARPYVRPRSREAGLPEEGAAHESRRSRGRRDEDEPFPESFPYGRPPSERPAGGRAR